MLLLDQGEPAAAERLFRALLAERPADPQSLRGLGRALAAQKRWPEAGEALESFLRASPDAVEELVLAGTAAYRSGDPRRAAAHFESALARSPANLGALLGLGILLGESGEDAAAATMLERASRASPAQPTLLTAYGMAAARAGRKAEARRALESSLALDPDQPAARETLRGLGG